MKAIEFRKLIEKHGILDACRQVKPTVETEPQAQLYVFGYVMRLLAARNLIGAAIILWGQDVFNPGPKAVQDVMRSFENYHRNLVQGCGGVSKTYSAVVWHLLDWLADPQYTSVKIVSATKGHAIANIYSTLVNLHRNAVVPLPGQIWSDYIGLDDKEKQSGIALVAIPIGDDGKGRLQGFHPNPRPSPHPTFGVSSRIRLYIDECIDAPAGLWKGVSNMALSMDENGSIKISGSYNPKPEGRNSETAKAAEPPGGWEMVETESGYEGKNEWMSKNQWHVLRIDGKRFENVVTRKTIFPGFINYIGYKALEEKDGGNTVDYFVMGRGMFPPQGAVNSIISPLHIAGARGEFVFIGTPIKCASCDPALDGGDNCVLTVGRTGTATGFIPQGKEMVMFQEPRRVVIADQQFVLPKGDTIFIGNTIKQTCVSLNVPPQYYCGDSTGTCRGVHDYLKSEWSPEVIGVNFAEKATEKKIMENDTATPYERFDGIRTELWYLGREWMEFGYFALAPGLRKDPMEEELTARQGILTAGQKLRVEAKPDYKKRTSNPSPDWSESLLLLPMGVRLREGVLGRMVDKPAEQKRSTRPVHSQHDRVKWFQDSGV